MARRRRYKSRVYLPGESYGRRGFLKKGLLGAVLLAAGGGGWLATRKTRPAPELTGPLRVLSPAEATVILALADRLVPERDGFPRPIEIAVPAKVDAIVGMADAATQKEIRQLIRLFESALSGIFEAVPKTFTDSSPEEQDRRIRGWAESRIALRRTGYRALKKMIYSAYYASPEVYQAIGYPGPPITPAAAPRHHAPAREEREPEAAAPTPAPAREVRRRRRAAEDGAVSPEPIDSVPVEPTPVQPEPVAPTPLHAPPPIEGSR